MAPIILELRRQEIEHTICVTAQHREMLDQVLGFFEINPDYDLNLMQKEQSLNSLSSLIFQYLDEVLKEVQPDVVLTQGDTTTAFITSLAAFNRGIKTGHIEAGLRTHNSKSPFPEEANRQMISRIADYHFAPTISNCDNLKKEGIAQEKIIITGNTVIDALLIASEKLKNGYENQEISKIKRLLNNEKKLILITGHRRESFDGGLAQVCEVIKQFSKEAVNVQIIFPVHLNPKVRRKVYEILDNNANICLIDPVSYPTFIWLMTQACVIVTDSGGIQEEAPSLKKPVLVTRDLTERDEALLAGFSNLVGTFGESLLEKLHQVYENPPDFTDIENPYGNGFASKKIIEFIRNA